MSSKTAIIALPAGTLIGPYRLEGELGRGGMGTVYRATQLSLDRQVALKVLHPKRTQDARALESFQREARIAAALDHQNLVPIYDVGQDNATGRYYYSMKMVSGRTLSTVIHQNGAQPWDSVRPIIKQIASAIGHAHNRKIVHRDLKPANIILTGVDQAVVTDLGLAMDRFSGTASTNKQRLLKLVGTAEYSAPEQLRNPDKASFQADVWAIGAIAYFMMTGEDPFSGETLLDLVVRVATETPRHLPRFPDVPRAIISNFMAKNPNDRPADGHAALVMMESYEQPAGPTTRAVGRRNVTGAARGTRTRRRR
jgi:serine/threonine-protein kinase